MAHDDVTVAPADASAWADVQTVMGTKGDPSSCWCQWFKLSRADWDAGSRAGKAELLHEQLATAPRGVVAYLGGEPVGWSAVEPFSAYPGLARSPITRRKDGDPEDPWAVTCFVVRLDYRNRGVARSLLAGAIAHAKDSGARVVEGYPVDPEVRPSLSNAERYHGTVRLFRNAGFEIVRRPSATRAIMRLELSAESAS